LGDLERFFPLPYSLIGSLNLSKVLVKGVAAALEKNAGENIESKGIKAHFK
jgi:hypoxia up-regulated 1